MPSITIIGVGRLGGALAIALYRKGYEVKALVHQRAEVAQKIAGLIEPPPRLLCGWGSEPIDSDIILITTQDTEITSAAALLVNRITHTSVVLHTSGSLSSDVLSGLREYGAAVGSFHPLVSISDPVLGAERFANAYFCIEGDPPAVGSATAMAAALGGKPFSIDTKFKPLYHASAVMASGHFVALEDMAIEMLSRCGLSDEEAKEVLIPLVRSTLENLETQPNEAALTGTFARADADAFERHLRSFEGNVPGNIREVYLLLAERSLELAEKAGVPPERISDLRDRIRQAEA